MATDWYRCECWNEGIEKEFFARLAPPEPSVINTSLFKRSQLLKATHWQRFDSLISTSIQRRHASTICERYLQGQMLYLHPIRQIPR